LASASSSASNSPTLPSKSPVTASITDIDPDLETLAVKLETAAQKIEDDSLASQNTANGNKLLQTSTDLETAVLPVNADASLPDPDGTKAARRAAYDTFKTAMNSLRLKTATTITNMRGAALNVSASRKKWAVTIRASVRAAYDTATKSGTTYVRGSGFPQDRITAMNAEIFEINGGFDTASTNVATSLTNLQNTRTAR
jgi:hypothetical protein